MLAFLIAYFTEGLYHVQESVPPSIIPWLEQNGPFAVAAGAFAWVAWSLWKHYSTRRDEEIKRLTEELHREQARGDRLEAELKQRNIDISDKYVMSLEEAKRVISEAVVTMRMTNK